MKFEEVLEERHSIVRLEKMRCVLERIPAIWMPSLPEPGWDDLILALDKLLTDIDPDYVIYQAKEKFGTLRFYAQCNPEKDSKNLGHVLIGAFENASKYVCEYCGSTRKVFAVPGAWVKSLCPECAKDAGWVPNQKK